MGPKCSTDLLSRYRSFTAVNGCNSSSHVVSSVSYTERGVYLVKMSSLSNEECLRGDEDKLESANRNGSWKSK